MDEPCSALDPISTLKVEELIHQLKENYTIVIVTHNMQQASRVADYTGFFNVNATEGGDRQGYLGEFNRTEEIFQNPQEEATKAVCKRSFRLITSELKINTIVSEESKNGYSRHHTDKSISIYSFRTDYSNVSCCQSPSFSRNTID